MNRVLPDSQHYNLLITSASGLLVIQADKASDQKNRDNTKKTKIQYICIKGFFVSGTSVSSMHDIVLLHRFLIHGLP